MVDFAAVASVGRWDGALLDLAAAEPLFASEDVECWAPEAGTAKPTDDRARATSETFKVNMMRLLLSCVVYKSWSSQALDSGVVRDLGAGLYSLEATP